MVMVCNGGGADAVHGCCVLCHFYLSVLYSYIDLKSICPPKSINFKLITFRNLFHVNLLAIYIYFNQFPCYDLLQPDVISYYF